jgi:hypothetical protein
MMQRPFLISKKPVQHFAAPAFDMLCYGEPSKSNSAVSDRFYIKIAP